MESVLLKATLALLSLIASFCVLASLDSSYALKWLFERTGVFAWDFGWIGSAEVSLALSPVFNRASLLFCWDLGSSFDSSSLASSTAATVIIFDFGESIYALDFS